VPAALYLALLYAKERSSDLAAFQKLRSSHEPSQVAGQPIVCKTEQFTADFT
jgi:hypothetical protein